MLQRAGMCAVHRIVLSCRVLSGVAMVFIPSKNEFLYGCSCTHLFAERMRLAIALVKYNDGTRPSSVRCARACVCARVYAHVRVCAGVRVRVC
jgi:hypothetical protein